MFHSLKSKRVSLTMGLLVCAAAGLTGCSSAPQGVHVTPQGTVPLDALKVGAPESIFKNAVITFVPNSKGNFLGLTQYLSREKDQNGGQMMAHCREGMCVGLEITHFGAPVPKDLALSDMKKMLPAGVTTEPKVEANAKVGGQQSELAEIYHYDKNINGQIIYADKSKAQVLLSGVWFEKPKTAAAPEGAQAQ